MPGLATVAGTAPFRVHAARMLDDSVTDLAWSEDGSFVLLGTASGTLHRLAADASPEVSWPAHDGGVTRVCLQPGGGFDLASAGEDGRVMLWDCRDGTARAVLAAESEWVEHLGWTPDGRVLAAAARKTISLWRGVESVGVWYDARRHVLAMAWAPDGRRLATAANKGLYLWRMDRADGGDADPVQILTFPGAPVSVAWQPHGKALAVGTQDGFLQIWRPATHGTKSRQLTMRGYPGKVNCLAWHPCEPSIATAGGPDLVLWDMPRDTQGARGRPLRHHQASITAVAWSGDGQLLASGDRSGRLCIWDSDGSLLFTQTVDHEISTLRWQPQHAVLCVGDTAGGLQMIGRTHTGAASPDARPEARRHE